MTTKFTSGFLNDAFGRATSPSRDIGILPSNFSTPQGALDVARGKDEAKDGALKKPINRSAKKRRAATGTQKSILS